MVFATGNISLSLAEKMYKKREKETIEKETFGLKRKEGKLWRRTLWNFVWERKMSDLNNFQCSYVLQPANCMRTDMFVIGQFMSLGLLLPYTTFITQPDSISLSDNKWRTDKVTFLCLFSLINMFWLAEQSHRQTETCRISGASEWVSCIDRKRGLLWGQCIDFLACQVWECREKSSFLSRRTPCLLSDSHQSHNCWYERLWK